MFVENLIPILNQIELLKQHHAPTQDRHDEWRLSFLSNISSHVYYDKPLSTEQARILLTMARKSATELSRHIDGTKLRQLLDNPVYRNEPYPSANIPREVRYIGEGKLAFRFKYDKIVIDALKQRVGQPRTAHASNDMYPRWDEKHRVWIVTVTRSTLQPIIAFIKEQRFQFDDAVVEYLAEAKQSQGGISSFRLDPETNQIVATVRDNEVIHNWVRTILGGQAR